ncbi:MAG: phosphate regulon sensor histidine kinase PhoR [Gammaproteobacteria bacterium]|nr:phosphate regulon sensor histidine kinase PhoR [Gammaproteobacteria bacterium]
MIQDKRNFVFKVITTVLIGTLVGLIYNQALIGFTVSILMVLIAQIRAILLVDFLLDNESTETKLFLSGYWEILQSKIQEIVRSKVTATSEIKNLEEEHAKSIKSMPDLAILLDHELNILLCNEAAITTIGIDPEKDINQKIINFIRDPIFIDYIHKRDFRRYVDIQSSLSKNYLRCRLVPYGANQYLLMVRDVSESYQLDKIRRDFVANASHELRTPLTVVSGYLDTLSNDESLDNEWKKPIKEMQRQSQRMSEIVSTLMELSQLEGKPKNDHQIIDIHDLMIATKKAFTESIKTPKIIIDCDKETYLMGEPFELESLLTNLLSNAVRHTSNDGEVRLLWKRQESGCRLSVEDTGEGIMQSDIPRLTERFFRAHRGRSRKEGGYGLGLAIVKHILKRHDGELEIQSKIGVGSKFICSFPDSRIFNNKKGNNDLSL